MLCYVMFSYVMFVICDKNSNPIILQNIKQQKYKDKMDEHCDKFQQQAQISGCLLNKIEQETSYVRNLVLQLRVKKKKSMGESIVQHFHLNNQCDISNIQPVSDKIDRNSFDSDLQPEIVMRRTVVTLSRQKKSEQEIGDRGLKYRPRGSINGRDDIRVRNLSDIHRKIVASVGKSRVQNKQEDNIELALQKLQQIQSNPQHSTPTPKHSHPQKKPFPSPFATQSQSLIQPKQLQEYLEKLPCSCLLVGDSSPTRIYQFFTQICKHLGIQKQFEQPLIKRYRNCIYFGQKVSQYGVYMGFVYYYRRALYYGEFQKGKKNGYGVEVDMEDPHNQCIWRGNFQNGKKTGYFQLISPRMHYNGSLNNSYFDGQGMLKTMGYSLYKGTFHAGMKHGYGVETFENKKSLSYKGQYFQNVFQGMGQLEGPNYYYKGYFRNGRAYGQGFERTPDFEYEGFFKNGKKSGVGTLKLKTGEQFKGIFQNGQLIKQSPIQISRSSPTSKLPSSSSSSSSSPWAFPVPLAYTKKIKIQSPSKQAQQQSSISSNQLQPQSKLKLKVNQNLNLNLNLSLKQKLDKAASTYSYSRNQGNNNHTSRNFGRINSNFDYFANYESRIIPLDKNLSKRLNSLYQQNQTQQLTIQHQKNSPQSQSKLQSQIFFKMHPTQILRNTSTNKHKQFDRIPEMSSPQDEDDEEEPLGIKLVPVGNRESMYVGNDGNDGKDG